VLIKRIQNKMASFLDPSMYSNDINNHPSQLLSLSVCLSILSRVSACLTLPRVSHILLPDDVIENASIDISYIKSKTYDEFIFTYCIVSWARRERLCARLGMSIDINHTCGATSMRNRSLHNVDKD
jgi:hypothetical protein